jgi:hypothetical protein
MFGLRKSTILLILLAAVGEVASIAIGLIVWANVGWQAALTVVGVGELIVITAVVALVVRVVKWFRDDSRKPNGPPRVSGLRPPRLPDTWV